VARWSKSMDEVTAPSEAVWTETSIGLEPLGSHLLLAIGADILHRDVALLLHVDGREIMCHPGQVRGLRLLQRQPPVVTGIGRVEPVEESVRVWGYILRCVGLRLVGSSLLAVRSDILHRDVALVLRINRSEMFCDPRHICRLDLLQCQPAIVTGIGCVEPVEKSVWMGDSSLRGGNLDGHRQTGLGGDGSGGETAGQRTGD
jgi:hypothetical protein